MIRNVVSNIGGIEVYGVVSICLFVTVFVGTVVWALCRQQPYLQAVSRLPLSDGEKPSPPAKGDSHE